MVVHDARWVVATCLLLGACASTGPTAPKPVAAAQEPQTVSAPPTPASMPTDEPVAAKVRGTEPVVIEEGKPLDDGQDLVAAAAAERERRRTAPPAMIEVNNKNLAQHATGKLTVSGVAAVRGAATPAATDADKDEKYWRDRVHGLREQWAEAVESIGELEARTANLRTRFYAEDDPYVRDGQIKPVWDRALEQLQQARDRARNLEDNLAVALEEGRQAGALPGWLRDGIELEPADRPYESAKRTVAHDDGNLVREPEELSEPPHR